jgi:hypothetical protein
MGDTCFRDGVCSQCRPGYIGRQCNERSPENCTRCKQLDYECLHCENRWRGLKCDEKCHSVCGGNGSCEIGSGNCHVCPVGYFGGQCDQTCSPYCHLNVGCDVDDGNCEGCVVGRHGIYCESQCSQNCINSTCLSNQTCKQGCEDGWF